MLCECTFPPGSEQLRVSEIGCRPSRGICFTGPLLAGTCGAVWRKAFLTGPRSPEELLETGRRTMSVEPGEQRGVFFLFSFYFEGWHHHSCKHRGAGTWPPIYSKGQESIHRDDHMAGEEQRDGGDDDPWQWHSGSMCHVPISSPDACICCHPVLESSQPHTCPQLGFIFNRV